MDFCVATRCRTETDGETKAFFFFVCLNRNKYISFVIWNEPIVLSLLHSVVDCKGGVKPLFYFFFSC